MSRIGIDIISIDRVFGWIDDIDIIKMVLTENEKTIVFGNRNPHKYIAGRFAAKEAAMKALGTGWGNGIAWKDIEVVSDSKGNLLLHFYGSALAAMLNKKSHLSITYTPELAAALVVISD